MKLKKHISPHGTTMAVSMMKDEAPYLIEWFAHHLALGFTDILVYTNDCTDGTDEMLIRLEELGLGHHRRNVIPPGLKPQPSAIKHAQAEPLVAAADWVILFDADEFMAIRYGDGTVDSLISAAGEANGIVITWRTFGSGGVIDWSRDPVTEQYTRAAPMDWNKGWGVKTLFKFDAEHWKLGIHRPAMKAKTLKTDYPNSVHWLNGSGLPMEDYFKYRGWRSIKRTLGYKWVQMNHYAVKGIDAYAVRKFRGNVNNKANKYNADYWSLMDRNESVDTTILRHAPKRAEIMAELLKDPVLSRLHNDALERVEARLAEFKKTDAYEELKQSLIAASNTPIDAVSAAPPKPRDPARVAAIMAAVEEKGAAPAPAEPAETGPYIPGRIDRSSDVPFNTVANHGIRLPADPRIFTPDALEAVANGKFDRKNARYIDQLASPGDRVLCLGAGIGFIPALLCTEQPGVTVMAHEERAELAAIAREIAADHRLASDRLEIIDGPLALDAGATGLAALLAEFRPTVLRAGDPRTSVETLAGLLPDTLRRVILPAGPDGTPMAKRADFEAAFSAKGLVVNEGLAGTGSLVFDRAA